MLMDRKSHVMQLARDVITQNPVFLDTETTGLNNTDQIVEIAIIDQDGTALISSLVRPTVPIPQVVTAIHGITYTMVKTALPWPLVWNEVRPILADRLVCGYNIDFDIQMMRQSHARYKIPWIVSFRKYDILKLYAEYRGDWDAVHRSYRFQKLEDAGNDLKVSEFNTHRALDDARMVRAVLFKLAGEES